VKEEPIQADKADSNHNDGEHTEKSQPIDTLVLKFHESMVEAHRVINRMREEKRSVDREEGAVHAVTDAIKTLDTVINAAKTHKRKEMTSNEGKSDSCTEDAPEEETLPKRVKCISTVHVSKVNGGAAHCAGCKMGRTGWSVLEGSPLRVSCDVCHYAMVFNSKDFV